jgi:hypothetical protein
VKGITDGCALILRSADIAPPRGLACSDLGDQRPGAGHCRKRFQSADDVRRADRVMLRNSAEAKHWVHFQFGVHARCSSFAAKCHIMASGQCIHKLIPHASPAPANEAIAQVVYGPKLSGRSCHGAPERDDPKDATSTRLSFTGDTPRGLFGRDGLMAAHS